MSTVFDSAIRNHRLPRVRVEQSIAVVGRVDGHVRRSAAITRDISMAGVFFYSDFSVPVGTSMQLMMTYPAEITYDQPISALCKGKVVRVERNARAGEFGVAVEIDSFEPVVGA